MTREVFMSEAALADLYRQVNVVVRKGLNTPLPDGRMPMAALRDCQNARKAAEPTRIDP